MHCLSVIAVMASIPLVACNSEQGALLVLHGDVAATKLEVVLASPTASVQVVQRHLGETPAELEDVLYYTQLSTSGAITEVDTIEDFRIRLEPNPAPEDFVPFVLAYVVDDNGEDKLVAAGRIHAGEGTPPMVIHIPDDRLDRLDVELEPIELPVHGIAANQGTLVRCARDNELRGAAWRFAAGLQVRLILPLPGEVSALGRALDLDCDESDVKTGEDCDDLQSAFNPQAEESGCTSPDYNCDGQSVSLEVCSLGGGCDGKRACNDPNTCVASQTPECRCVTNECASGLCKMEYTTAGAAAGMVTPCQPAVAIIPGLCPGGVAPCEVKLKAVSTTTWTIELGDAQGQFSDTAALAEGDSLLIRASHIQGPLVSIAGGPDEGLAEFDLEYRNQTQTLPTRFLVSLSLGSAANAELCTTITIPNANSVTSMQCALGGP